MIKTLLCLMLGSFTWAGAGGVTIVTCPRPFDMSIAKPVAAFEDCMEKKRAYCARNDKEEDCKRLLAQDHARRIFPSNPDDIDPTQRCTILKDNSYKCLQDPIKFFAKEVSRPAPAPAPSASPSGSPSASPSENPSSGNASESPGAPPPVPPPAAPPPPVQTPGQ